MDLDNENHRINSHPLEGKKATITAEGIIEIEYLIYFSETFEMLLNLDA